MNEQKTFPIITEELQRAFEKSMKDKPDCTPDICGYYGRACLQKGKTEGANRMLCMGCPLANY